MNVYLISRTDLVDWDEYHAFVIVANTEEEAKALCSDDYSWTKDKTAVEVKIVGTTTEEYTEAQIILGSFNAG